MAIRFTCSHCSRSLTVKDELAGKRGRCPYCKQVIVVPASRATAPVRDPRKPDAESLALAALGLSSSETVTGAETVSSSKPAPPIQVTCSWCDHQFEVEGTLAGKQTPCPECRRIVRVPAAQTQSPRDWRQAARAPTAAVLSQQQAAPEGAWGTATARSYVSQEALEEAEALPIEREPLTVGQWATRIGLALLALVALYAGYRWFTAHRAESWQRSWLAETQQFLENPQRSPEQTLLVQLALMRYWQNTEPDNNRIRGVSRTARQLAAAAREQLGKLATANDPVSLRVYEGMLVEYVAQCCAAGLLPDDINPGLNTMLRRPDAETLLRKTVARLADLQADMPNQRQGLQVLRRMLEQALAAPRTEPAKAPVAATQSSADLLAVAAQEFAALGDTESARAMLKALANQQPSPSKKPGEETKAAVRAGRNPASLAEVVARVMLESSETGQGQTAAVADAGPNVGLSPAASAVIQLEVLVRKGRWSEAVQHWKKHWPPGLSVLERWPGLQLLAEGVLHHGDDQIVADLLNECEGLEKAAPPRILPEVRLLQVRLATAAKKEEVARQLIEQAGPEPMRRMLRLAQAETVILRARECLLPEQIPSWQELQPAERAYLLQQLAWHNVRKDRGQARRWADSLSGADRAIVAAVLLACDSAADSR
jgi:DNA-directed RNA polymerase subunit RPC12/RpoP